MCTRPSTGPSSGSARRSGGASSNGSRPSEAAPQTIDGGSTAQSLAHRPATSAVRSSVVFRGTRERHERVAADKAIAEDSEELVVVVAQHTVHPRKRPRTGSPKRAENLPGEQQH